MFSNFVIKLIIAPMNSCRSIVLRCLADKDPRFMFCRLLWFCAYTYELVIYLFNLIWVYTVCKGLSVPIRWIITSWRCIDVEATLYKRHVPTGYDQRRTNKELQQRNRLALRKPAYSNMLKILPTKKWKFSDKKFYFSHFCSKHRLWIFVRTASARRF